MRLTLEEFRATRTTVVKDKDWCDDEMPGRDTCTVLEYGHPVCWIAVVEDEKYYLVIGNADYLSPDLGKLEEALYRDWYAVEILQGLGAETPTMTRDQQMTLDQLRKEGFAVTVFNPKELQGADPSQVEDLMVSRGWDAIETLKEVESEGGNHD